MPVDCGEFNAMRNEQISQGQAIVKLDTRMDNIEGELIRTNRFLKYIVIIMLATLIYQLIGPQGMKDVFNPCAATKTVLSSGASK